MLDDADNGRSEQLHIVAFGCVDPPLFNHNHYAVKSVAALRNLSTDIASRLGAAFNHSTLGVDGWSFTRLCKMFESRRNSA